MKLGMKRCLVVGTTLLLSLPLVTTWAAEKPSSFEDKLKNVQLCNGSDRSSPERQIAGCTALIDVPHETTRLLAVAHNNRGNAYAENGDFDHAIADYDVAIKLNPTYAKPFNNRGLAYQKKGDYDRAIKEFDEAIKLSPNYGNAFANRAAAYQKKNDYERAAQDTAIHLEPNLAAAWNGRCWVRAILGQLQVALADCNKAVALKPNDAGTYDSRGLTHLKMGEFNSAIQDYSTALRLEPKLATALYGRGLAEIKKGDASSGNADLAAAKAINASVADDFARYGVKS